MSATTSFAADPDSQTIKARDSFELIRRLGDVVLRKQTVKRNEATAQIDKENLATAEATLIAAGTDDDAGATSNLTHLSLEDLLQRAEALTVADADLVKETSISYEDLVDN
ncbi:hypothetical protein OC846_002948 [Tilletia horrida]|uniref:Uncharacterized protein n=1 Tax=Tilletia horrida TaxID=155126 RepID=A0AAN6GRB9_9BASI|nr:hypothetical protein OC846_002948 [Tilletia horrida]KAK0566869.1 hypothetical protein OC861_002991 [Tilletia horrida]